MKLNDKTQTISVKQPTHGVTLHCLVNFSEAVTDILRDICTTKDAVDTQLLQLVRNRVQLPEGTAEIKQVGSHFGWQNIPGQFMILCGRCSKHC